MKLADVAKAAGEVLNFARFLSLRKLHPIVD
jgi:hypothetical protein